MKPVGIEKIFVYPCSLGLDMASLCAARGVDPAEIRDEMMIDERSLNPLWEDPVTMAVRAALPILNDSDRNSIELLIVASESGVDQEKPMSTWVHRYLGLKPQCRNFEVKHACYGGTAALQMAISWLASGLGGMSKALVISTDQSRMHIGKPWEFVLGAGAVAMLISNTPQLVEFELGASGYWTEEVSDVTRPTSTVETGNSETSLVSYIEALEGAYEHYVQRVRPAADLNAHLQRFIYHTPFGGITWRAHRTLLRHWKPLSKAEARAHFDRTSLPALRYARRMGGTLSSSTFIGLVGLLDTDPGVRAGDRIGLFSYGAGSCAEFYSVKACPAARTTAAAAGLKHLLDSRRMLTVSEYEGLERRRVDLADRGDYETRDPELNSWFDQHYAGRGYLVFTGMKDFYRQYAWS